MTLTLRPVQAPSPNQRIEEPPYRWFIAASLTLGIGGGFALALLLPIARLSGWEWAVGPRWGALAQAHGQLQLLGFVGLFITGMAFRLMPRFSGRPLALRNAVPWLIPLVAAALLIRMVAQPWTPGAGRDAALVASAALTVAAAIVFGAVIAGTLGRRDSRAGATGWFFLLGAAGYLAAAALNAVAIEAVVRDDLWTAPALRQNALLATQFFGFVMMFIGGVGLRAVPTLSGLARPEAPAKVAAVALAAGVTLHAASLLWAEYGTASSLRWRASDAGLLFVAAALAAVALMSGALRPAANRVAAASQTQFWLVRSAFAWLLLTAALVGWYAVRALADGTPVDAYELDTVRHALAIGVVTSVIVGIGILVVPEFAGRRLQHPGEGRIALAMVAALNLAAVLRAWPPARGVEWLGDERSWPIAASGALTLAVVVAFAFMFAQSYREQRRPGWSEVGGQRPRVGSRRPPTSNQPGQQPANSTAPGDARPTSS